jgi:hypothetical protein
MIRGVAMEKFLSKNWVCCGLIRLFTILIWGSTVGFEFVWDDSVLVVQNTSIRSLRNLPEIFTSVNAQSAELVPSFRPTRTAFYALLFALVGKPAPQPWIFHLANVLWHALAAMLLFLVARLLCQRLAGVTPLAGRITALLIALGFAAHPVISEAVCWVKCLDDLMAAVFVLSALWFLLQWKEDVRGYVAVLVLYLIAVFSKESAVPMAVIAFLVFGGIHNFSWRRSALFSIPFLMVAGLYVTYRHTVLGQSAQCAPISGSYGQSLIDMFPVVLQYWRLLWGIPPFCADYDFMVGMPPHSIFSAAVLGGAFLVMLLGGLAAWLWRRPQWRLCAFGLFWLGLFLLPVSNLLPMMQFMAERFLYLPLMGFLLALGVALLHLSRFRPRLIIGVAAVLIVIWTGTSLTRMGVWKDDLSLCFRTEFDHPGIARVEHNAVVALFRLPQMKGWRMDKPLSAEHAEQIVTTLQRARQIYPNNDQLTTQMGLTYAKMERWPDAVAMLELAAQQNPALAERWFNLASVYERIGETAKAREACAKALRLRPFFGKALHMKKQIEEDMKGANIRRQ